MTIRPSRTPAGAIAAEAAGVRAAWDGFFFPPERPHTLAALRIAAGLLLVYTHLTWLAGSDAFFGEHAWIPGPLQRSLAADRGDWVWTPLYHLSSPGTLIPFHLLAVAAMACWTVGLASRPAGVLAWLFTLAYVHRQTGALFGLDHVNVMLAMYLMLAPCGAVWSVDSLRRRRGWTAGRWEAWLSPPSVVADGVEAFTSARVATRLLQLHLCVVYLFSGLAKLRGTTWQNGWAIWFAVANDEYQSLDLTGLMAWPWLIALVTHGTVALETFYCALVWPRWTRPLTVLAAVAMHLGIAVAIGMPTFGLAMVVANGAFLPPALTAGVVGAVARTLRLRSGPPRPRGERGGG